MADDDKDLEADAMPEPTQRERRALKGTTADLTPMLEPMAAFSRELSILRTIQPLALNFQTTQFALDLYKPAVEHMRLFDQMLQGATLLANKNLSDTISAAVQAATAVRITQDSVRTAAWAAMLTRAALPAPSVMKGLTTAVSAMSFDISKYINANVSILASSSFVMPATSFGSAFSGVSLADLLSGPIASSLASFRETTLGRAELPPVAFSTVAGAGIAGVVFPDRPYEKPTELDVVESEMRSAGIELVRAHYPKLARKLDGARYALRGGNPDAVSQAANSLIEAIDQFLRGSTSDEEVIAWCLSNYKPGTYQRGQRLAPTRAGRINYLAHVGGVSNKIGEGIATIVTTAMDLLQQAKHSESNEDIVRNLGLIVEGSIGATVSMTLPDRSES